MKHRRKIFQKVSLSLLVILGLSLFPLCEAEAREPIKIGVLVALSGPASSIGTSTKLVTKMVVDRINREGGINGQPLELVVGDTESDPHRAITEARRLVEKENVVAIIGPTRTDEGMAVKPYIEETARIPIIMTVGGDRVIAGGPFGPFRYTFKIPQRNTTAVKKIYGYLREQNISRVALLTATDGFGQDGLSALEGLAEEFGMEIVSKESFSVTDTDMTPQLMNIGEGNPEALICWTIGPAGARVALNFRQLEFTMPLIQCHGQADPEYIELAGYAANGSIMPATKLMVHHELPEIDPQKAVIENFMTYYRDIYQYDERHPINAHSGYAWDATYFLANALRQVGTDSEALRSIIERTRGYVGISGIFNLTPEDHNGLNVHSLVMVRVEEGQWVLHQP